MKRIVLIFMILAWAVLPEQTFGLELFGYTEPIRIAQAAFAESGVLDAIFVREGDHVGEGDVLAHLDIAVLERDLNIAKEAKRIQNMHHAQLENLFEEERVSAVEIERSRSDTLIAEERVQRILAQLDARILRAPFDGVIVRVFRERSENISAARAEVLTIAQLDVLQVVLHVPLERIEYFDQQRPLPVILEDEIEAEAQIVFVSPVIDAASRTIRVRLEIPNPDGVLRAGMICRIRL